MRQFVAELPKSQTSGVIRCGTDGLPEGVAQGLLDAAPDVVVLAGGTAALSDAVLAEVQAVLPNAEVRRVAGGDRFSTAVALAALIREYEPAFAYDLATDGATFTDTNAFGIACPSGQVMTGIDGDGAAVCSPDNDTDTDTDTNAFGISCPGGQVLVGISSTGDAQCDLDLIDGGDAGTLDGIDSTGFVATDTTLFVKSNTNCGSQVVIGSTNTGALSCATVGSAGVTDDSLTDADLASSSVTASELAANAVRIGDLALTIGSSSADVFGNLNNGACSSFFGNSAAGAVATNRTVVFNTYLAATAANPGWVIEGGDATTAGTNQIRVCNRTGAVADPPNLRFDWMTFGR